MLLHKKLFFHTTSFLCHLFSYLEAICFFLNRHVSISRDSGYLSTKTINKQDYCSKLNLTLALESTEIKDKNTS